MSCSCNNENNDNALHIVFCTDSDFCGATYIAIYSMLKNYRGDRNIVIYILSSDDYYQQYYERVIEIIDEVSVSFVYISMRDMYKDVRISNKRISVTTLYRLSIPRVLNGVSRCIYLDSDVIVEGNISELYDIDLDGMMIAAVKDAYIPYKDYKKMRQVLNIHSMDKYFNAGVLLMDLDRIRTLQLDKKMEDLGSHNNNYPYNDQDVLNIVFNNMVKLIPQKFNMNTAFLLRVKMSEEYDDIKAINPVIIHFIGYVKPWSYPESVGAKLWWKYVAIQDDAIIQPFLADFIKKQRGRYKIRIREACINVLIQCRLLDTVKRVYYFFHDTRLSLKTIPKLVFLNYLFALKPVKREDKKEKY